MRPVQSHLNKSLETVDENLSLSDIMYGSDTLKDVAPELTGDMFGVEPVYINKEEAKAALGLAADVTPFVGSAKALTELPEDAQFAYELLQQGYDEGSITKMGLGAGFGVLTAAGFIPGAKIATDLGQRAIKEGVAETASDVVDQTRAAFKADPSSMDSAKKKRLIEQSKDLPPNMRRKFVKEGLRPTPKLFHGAQGIGDFEVDDTQILADIKEAQKTVYEGPLTELYKTMGGEIIGGDQFFAYSAAKGISVPHVAVAENGTKYLDFLRIEDGGEIADGTKRVINLVSDDSGKTIKRVVPQINGEIYLRQVKDALDDSMKMNQGMTDTYVRDPDSLVSRGERLANEGFEPFSSFKGARGLTGADATGRHAELKEKALSMSRDPLVSMKPGFGARRLDNIVYSDLPKSLQRNLRPSDYDDVAQGRITLSEVISRMTDEEIDKVFNEAPEFYEAMKEGRVNLHARIQPSEAARKRNIGLALPKSGHLEAETAILEPQELSVRRLSEDSEEVREIYPMIYKTSKERKQKLSKDFVGPHKASRMSKRRTLKDLGKLPLGERVREGQKLANTVLDRFRIIENAGDTGGDPRKIADMFGQAAAAGPEYNYQALKEMFNDLQSLGQFTEQYGARGTYDSFMETIAKSQYFREGLRRTAEALKDKAPEKYKNLKMLEVVLSQPSARMAGTIYDGADTMTRTRQRSVKDKTLLEFIESDIDMPPELSSMADELAYNDVKRAMFLITQKLNRGGLMVRK